MVDNSNLNLETLTLAAARDALDKGQTSAVALTQGYLDRIDAHKDWNVYITVAADKALATAQASDETRKAGKARALEGLPIAVKDNFCTEGVLTTAASKILENFVPTYESTVTAKLRDAGAVMLGKVNMDEFAMGSSTESSHFGPTVNPVGARLGGKTLVPGGSSGGSAAAVAGGLAAAALGSDTGGSIRQPASFCGIVGFKPTYGVCSRWGIIAYASSLDQAGVLARTVGDAAMVMDVISGTDDKDTTSNCALDGTFSDAIAAPDRPLRIGFVKEVRQAGKTEATEAVWARAEQLAAEMGAEIVDVSIPTFRYALPAYYIIALSEASSNLARYDGVKYGYRTAKPGKIEEMYENTRAEGFGAEVKRRIILGTHALSSGYYDQYYAKAQKVRQKIFGEFKAVFGQCDVLFMPTTPTGAFEQGSHSNDPVAMYLEDIYTVAINMGGLPAISIPATQDAEGRPLGLQIVGPTFGDLKVMAAAAHAERLLG